MSWIDVAFIALVVACSLGSVCGVSALVAMGDAE